MRVLFVVNPENTIFQSMVPLAWAFRTAGHDVRVASQPRFGSIINQAGLTGVPVGRDVDTWRLADVDPELREIAAGGLPPPWSVAANPTTEDWWEQVDCHRDAVESVHKPENFPIIAGLVNFARAWRPDLIVWEPLAYAGPIAAKACGATHARVLWGLDVFGVTREVFGRLRDQQPEREQADPLAEWLGGYARRYGADFSEDMTTGNFTINQLAPSLSLPTRLPRLHTRYVPYGGPSVVAERFWAAPMHPRVLLTLGTTAVDRLTGYAVNVGDILEALADVDVEVVATLADAQRERLGSLPTNASVVSFAPLQALASTCAAVIHHGGFGTLNTVALAGVPQVVLPYHFEGPLLARQLERQGAGVAIPAAQATGAAVRAAVLRVLSEPAFRAGAVRLREEMRTTPTLNDVVPEIVARVIENQRARRHPPR